MAGFEVTTEERSELRLRSRAADRLTISGFNFVKKDLVPLAPPSITKGDATLLSL